MTDIRAFASWDLIAPDHTRMRSQGVGGSVPKSSWPLVLPHTLVLLLPADALGCWWGCVSRGVDRCEWWLCDDTGLSAECWTCRVHSGQLTWLRVCYLGAGPVPQWTPYLCMSSQRRAELLFFLFIFWSSPVGGVGGNGGEVVANGNAYRQLNEFQSNSNFH